MTRTELQQDQIIRDATGKTWFVSITEHRGLRLHATDALGHTGNTPPTEVESREAGDGEEFELVGVYGG